MTGLTLTLTIPDVNTDWYGSLPDDAQGETLRDGAVDVWADLQEIKTTLEAADITSFDQMPTPLPSDQFVKTNTLGTAFSYSSANVGAHAVEHLPLGSDPLAGDSLSVTYTGVDYTATSATLGGHLAGIDTKVAELDAINVPGQAVQDSLLTGTTPTAGADIDLAGNNLVSNNDVALYVDIATAGNGACRVRGASANAAAMQTDGAQANIDLILAGKGNGHPKISHGGAVSRLNTVRDVMVDLTATSDYTIVADDTFGNETDEGKTFLTGNTNLTLPLAPADGFVVRVLVANNAFGQLLVQSPDVIVTTAAPGATDASGISLTTVQYRYMRLTYWSGTWYQTGSFSPGDNLI